MAASYKNLYIMQDPIHKPVPRNCLSDRNTALLSPPLTPTEPKFVYSVPWQQGASAKKLSPLLTDPTDNSPRLVAPLSNRRKRFIQEYAHMIEFLRPISHGFDRRQKPSSYRQDMIFSLDVYGTMAEESTPLKKRYTPSALVRKPMVIEMHNDGGHGNEEGRSCTTFNKDAVHLSFKRIKSIPDGSATKKMKIRVSSAKPSLTTLPAAPIDAVTSPVPSKSPTKKEKVDLASVFDIININIEDEAHFPPAWIPQSEALDRIPVKVAWKGAPLQINHQPYYSRLHPVEVRIASTLRLSPIQYIRCKRVLIRAAQEYSEKDTAFRKSDAQKLCRVDVNKTSALWTVFGQLGWMGHRWPN
ncbi:hypothetical protein BDF14DRAFT_1777008 [Spinellus fusiger]|nr:hypothetical protein BDF14DRAFT_1777008 [Spinellus fusiger]